MLTMPSIAQDHDDLSRAMSNEARRLERRARAISRTRDPEERARLPMILAALFACNRAWSSHENAAHAHRHGMPNAADLTEYASDLSERAADALAALMGVA